MGVTKLAKGVYRDSDGWVTVDYGTSRMPIDRDTYEENGYLPPFDKLPSKEEYEAGNTPKSKG